MGWGENGCKMPAILMVFLLGIEVTWIWFSFRSGFTCVIRNDGKPLLWVTKICRGWIQSFPCPTLAEPFLASIVHICLQGAHRGACDPAVAMVSSEILRE